MQNMFLCLLSLINELKLNWLFLAFTYESLIKLMFRFLDVMFRLAP